MIKLLRGKLNMNKNVILSWGGTSLTAVLASIQTNEVFQIVEIIIAIITALATLAFTIWKWWKTAKADGKISIEEIKALAEELGKSEAEVEEILKKKRK